MELLIKPAEVTIPQTIENFEEIKAELLPKVEFYSSLIVTEDSIKKAKSEKADLNKLRSAIDDQRKEVKKQCLALQATFESQCNELTAMIDRPIEAIDRQLKSFEEQRRQEKYKELEGFFVKINCLPFVRLEHVLDPKWGNAGAKLDKLKQDIAERVQRHSDEYSELKALYGDSPLLTAILERYAETLNKSDALAYAAVLEKREAQRRQQEQLKEKKEAARQAGTLVDKVHSEPQDVKITTPLPQEYVQSEAEPILAGCFAVRCTRQNII